MSKEWAEKKVNDICKSGLSFSMVAGSALAGMVLLELMRLTVILIEEHEELKGWICDDFINWEDDLDITKKQQDIAFKKLKSTDLIEEHFDDDSKKMWIQSKYVGTVPKIEI